MPNLKAIYRYPVKSLGGESLPSIMLTAHGLSYDRHWMLVNDDHEFMTQRQNPIMTQIHAAVSDGKCVLTRGEDSISFNVNEVTGAIIETQVWNHAVVTQIVSEEASTWLSDHIGQRVHLVGAGKRFQRHKERAGNMLPLKFQDGYPILVLSQASVDLLNDKLEEDMTEHRFRANMLIDDCSAHSEDVHQLLQHANYQVKLESACKRCILINTDQRTGQVGKEPLKTLSAYRQQENQVLFGRNASVASVGKMTVGDILDYI